MARPGKNAITKEVGAARRALKRAGYTYHEAAEVLGVSYGHLAMVLACHRESKRLLSAILNLPERKEATA